MLRTSSYQIASIDGSGSFPSITSFRDSILRIAVILGFGKCALQYMAEAGILPTGHSSPSSRNDAAMWTCSKCGEQLEDTFEACWNCGTTTDGVEDDSFQHVEPPGEEIDQSIAIEARKIHLEKALEYSNLNYGLGIIGAEVIPLLFMGFGAVAMALYGSEDWATNYTLAALLAATACFCVWLFVFTIRVTPLKIRIADKVTVRYLLHSREWESYQMAAIRFQQNVHLMWVITLPIPIKRHRMAILTMTDGSEIEFLVTPDQEVELRRVFETTA